MGWPHQGEWCVDGLTGRVGVQPIAEALVSGDRGLDQFPSGHITRFSRKSCAISISGRESGPPGATSSGLSFRLRLAVGDPGFHLVVVVGEIVLGDVVGGGGPDAVIPEDVA